MKNKKNLLDTTIDKLSSKPEYAETIFIKNALPQKLSGILLDFAKPLLDVIDINDRQTFEAAITMAIIIWNYAVLKEKKSKSFVDRLKKKKLEFEIFKAFYDIDGQAIFSTLLARKKELYPDNSHGIADFEMNWSPAGNGFNFVVIATM